MYTGPVIDIHNHPDWCGHNLDKYLENMDTYGIEKTWLLSWECPEHEYSPSCRNCIPAGALTTLAGPIPFARCVSYKERAPERFVLGYAPDPRLPTAVDDLRAAVEIYGVQICGELKVRMMYDSPDAIRLFRYCGEAKLPVIVHIDYPIPTQSAYPNWSYWYGGGMDAFERALQQCPETTFLGHAPGFWAHISGDEQYDKEYYPKGPVVAGGKLQAMLEAYPNLYCDLSAGSALNALARDPEHAKTFLLTWQDRVLFARDYFDNRLRDFLDTLDLPTDAMAKICAGNATAMLAK